MRWLIFCSPPSDPMKATIREVADKAGVSVATVSRVFNNSPKVVEETRKRIILVADELRYSPNYAARSLSTQRTESIGMLLPDLHGEFFSEVIRGVDETVQEQKHHLVVSSSHNKKSEIQAALKMMRGRVDGLIVMSPDIDAKTLEENLPSKLPVVLLNCFVDDTAFDSINIDNVGGAYHIVMHLFGHKHTRIAIIKGTERNRDATLRLQGYSKALAENNIAREEELLFPGDFTDSAGYDATRKILSMKNRPTAIFASNDSMAIGALIALRELNVEVPEEMAVVGFDDIPMARIARPKLTTVHVAINELGKLASETLFAAIRDKEQHVRHHRLIPTDISIRESCGTH